MKRVASLYLPDWPIDRLRRRSSGPPPEPVGQPEPVGPPLEPGDALDAAPLGRIAATAAERQCSAPPGGGWRPGARWARASPDARSARASPDARSARDSNAAPAPAGAGGKRSAREQRADLAAEIAAMPAHRRPPTRELGRRSEAADPPFKAWRGHGDPAPADAAAVIAPAAAPRVTALRQGGRIVVAAACPAARRLGIRAGMAITQARAQHPAITVDDADPAGDRADLHRLAIVAARRWAPHVALSGDDGLFLDISGTAHLFGGEAQMARRIIRLLARVGVTARLAVADSAGAAWALARWRVGEGNPMPACPVLICPPGTHRTAIAGLPPAALRIDPAATELLARLGVGSIGQLVAMPRAPLARRFGAALVARLDQALGDAPEPIDPVIPPQAIAVGRRFVEPIATADAIGHWLNWLMPQLVTALTRAGLGARSVELVAERIDGVPQRLRIGLARPTRDTAHLLRLVTRRIEEIAPGYGIDAMTLHVHRADPLAAQPFDERLGDAGEARDLAPLVDTIANRIGSDRLWRVAAVESDVPERSVAAAPAIDPPARAATRLDLADVRRLDRRVGPHPWQAPRPVRLLRRPERVDDVIALLPDQPPRRFRWRGHVHRVVRADGPERIHGEWWVRGTEAAAVRDYFCVEDEAGSRFWLFRRGDGERSETGDLAWFIHGAFG